MLQSNNRVSRCYCKMNDHYFSEKPHSKHVNTTITCKLRHQTFVFTTGTGVFSRKGIDYGSKLLIESFEVPNVEGKLLDLGCGYGPIGISLAHSFKDRTIFMVDINERAVSLAEQNAKDNDTENVKVIQSNGFTSLSNQTFASIITNPPIRTGKKVIYQLFDESRQFLKRDGELWVVVQKKQGAPSMITYLTSLFGNAAVVAREKGYHVIKCRYTD